MRAPWSFLLQRPLQAPAFLQPLLQGLAQGEQAAGVGAGIGELGLGQRAAVPAGRRTRGVGRVGEQLGVGGLVLSAEGGCVVRPIFSGGKIHIVGA